MPIKKSPQTKRTVAANAVNSAIGQEKVTVLTKSAHYEGPIPPASELTNYDNVIPGLAERIVLMAEKEQESRLTEVKNEDCRKDRLIEIADAESKSAIKGQRRGQWMGWSISMACVASAIFSICIGAHESVTIAFLAVPTAALVGAFIPKINTLIKRRPDTKESKE